MGKKYPVISFLLSSSGEILLNGVALMPPEMLLGFLSPPRQWKKWSKEVFRKTWTISFISAVLLLSIHSELYHDKYVPYFLKRWTCNTFICNENMKSYLEKDSCSTLKCLRRCKMNRIFMHLMKLLCLQLKRSYDIISPSGQGLFPFHRGSPWASQGLGCPQVPHFLVNSCQGVNQTQS